jgi:hypothetical protein
MASKSQKIVVLSAGAALALSATVTVTLLGKEPSLMRPSDSQAAMLQGMDAAAKDQSRQAWLHVAGRD